MVRFGLWVQVNSALAFVQANLDKFIIASFVALAPVAAYELGSRITSVALLGPTIALSALLPAVAHRTAAGGAGADLAFYRRASYPYFVAVGLIVGGLLGLAHPLLELWLGAVQPAQVFMLRGLAVAIGLSAATGIASTLVRAGDRLDLETQYAVASVALHVALSLLGIRLWGWPGAIYGLVASSLAGTLFFLFRVEAWLGGPPLREAWVAGRAPLLAASAGAALAAWVVAAAVPGNPGRGHGFVSLLVGSAALAAAFGTMLVLSSPRRWRELLWPLALAGSARGSRSHEGT
jgi:O-antigen/teichoic acid export membrane protein